MAKKFCVLLLGIVAGMFLWRVDCSASTWNLEKEYTKSKGKAVYHAYLSEDKQESWIYKVDLKEEHDEVSLTFPNKMAGAPVTRLGGAHELEGEDYDAFKNVFDSIIEPWHDEGGNWYEDTNVKKIILPDTIKTIETATFAGMNGMSEIHLPKSLEKLNSYTFYNCKKLKKITCSGEKIVISTQTAFENCKQLKGLTSWLERKENAVVTLKKDMLYADNGKTLVQVMPVAKKVKILAKVSNIQSGALNRVKIKKLTVSKKNTVFATQKQCLYEKENGELIAIYNHKNKVSLPKKIKRVGNGISIAEKRCKKIVFPYPIILEMNWYENFVKKDSFLKICFRAKKVPELKSQRGILPAGSDVYIPKKYKKKYKKWMKAFSQEVDVCNIFYIKK